MSSEMREFEELSKDAVKDGSDHTNDAQSEIADLRKENKKGAEKIVDIKKTIPDSPAKKALDGQQQEKSALLAQIHQNEVGEVDSSAKMCLIGDTTDLMNPDYFTDFLITAGEPLDKQRPSYTLLRGSNDVTLSSEKGLTGAGKASNGPKGDSFVKDFADLRGLADIPINFNRELNYGVNGESPISSSRDILTANAMESSGGIGDLGTFSTGFPNASLSMPKTEKIPDAKLKPANRIASN